MCHVLSADEVYDNPTSEVQLQLPLRHAGDGHRPARTAWEFAYYTSCPDDVEGYRQETQHELTVQKEDEIFKALIPRLSQEQLITSLSACGPHAAAFMRVNGDSCIDEMPDEAYQAALRVRIGLAPFSGMRLRCRCDVPHYVKPHDHAMCCPCTKGGARIARHDAIKGVIERFLRECGFYPDVEPPGYDDASQKRPDILARVGNQVYAIEVSVTHPIQSSQEMRRAAATVAGYAMNIRIAQKRQKYSHICASKKQTLVVCAVETFGRVSPDFVRFVKQVVTVSNKGSFGLEDAAQRLFNDVSVALHTGNMDVWRAYNRM